MRIGWLLLGLGVIACAEGVDDGVLPAAGTTTTSSPNQAGPTSNADAGAGTGAGTTPGAPSTGSGSVNAPDAATHGANGASDAGAPPPPPPPPPPAFTVTNETITVSGKVRSYVLVVPSSYSAAKAYPLLLALHGDGGDGPSFHAAWPLENASGQNAIIAYPSGNANTWDLYSPVDQDQDVAFLVQLVGALRGRFDIGSAFSLGFSSGAFMSNQMACREPTLFKGIVSHSGGTPDEPNASHGSWGGDFVKCNGQTSGVAAMLIHGTADTTVPFPSGEHDANYWATVNGCGSGYSAFATAPCQARNGCPSDKPVVYCPVDGLGHALWDQSASAAWTFISGL